MNAVGMEQNDRPPVRRLSMLQISPTIWEVRWTTPEGDTFVSSSAHLPSLAMRVRRLLESGFRLLDTHSQTNYAYALTIAVLAGCDVGNPSMPVDPRSEPVHLAMHSPAL